MAFLSLNAVTPRRRAIGRSWGLWLLALVALRLTTLAVVAQPAPSAGYQIKAVFLFHFAQFVEWPATAFPTAKAPLVIGILGDDPFGHYLDELVKDEAIGGHKITVARYPTAEEAAQSCHILFIGNSESSRLGKIIPALSGAAILTVSDVDDFSQRGGMVRFVTESGKIRLRINAGVAKARGLSISSKILRAATLVSEAKP
jgi:hypothetical protein